MKRRRGAAALFFALVVSAVTVTTAQQVATRTALTADWPRVLKVDGIEILSVRKNVYMLVGGGANVTIQIGDEGVTMVDSGATGQAEKILAAVRQISRRPVRFLINTSSDPDHVSGNGAIVTASGGSRGPGVEGAPGGAGPRSQNVGVLTIAHENAFNRLSAGSKALPALTGDALPASTFFTPRKDFYANDEPVQLLYQPNAHSDGDVIVFFRGSDVVSAGDVFRTDSYPVIDAAQGGTIQGELDALNNILDITVPERNQMGGTRVVPGHGHIGNEADVLEYRDMLTIIRDRIREMVRNKMTLQQVKAAHPTLEYDGLYGNRREWTGEMFVEAVYRDLSKSR
jgi:glyoxylase-like metal-dependent hydrolase (beta-lactamase superfamily II)